MKASLIHISMKLQNFQNWKKPWYQYSPAFPRYIQENESQRNWMSCHAVRTGAITLIYALLV